MKKRMALCLLAAAVAFGICALGLIAPTFARVQNTAIWQESAGFLEDARITSDLLSPEGQTVVLNPMRREREITIHLTGEAGTASGTLTCNSGTYVTVTFDQSNVTVRNGETLAVKATLTPTDQWSELAEGYTETLEILWTPTGGSGTALSAQLKIPITLTEDTGEAEQGEVDVTVQNPSNLISSWVSSYSEEMPIAVALKTLSVSRTVTLRCNGGNFPALTRYTVGGKSVVLYDGGEIALEVKEAVTVLIDVSQTELPEAAQCVVTASAELTSGMRMEGITLTPTGQSTNFGQTDTPILTTDSYLDFWDSRADDEVTLFRLETGEGGSLVWVEIKPEEQCGIQQGINSDGGVRLSIDTDARPQAGTYKIELVRLFHDSEMFRDAVVFFVQYDTAA